MLMDEGCTAMFSSQWLLWQWLLSEFPYTDSFIVLFHVCERIPMHPCGFVSIVPAASCSSWAFSSVWESVYPIQHMQQQLIYMKWLLLVVFAWQGIGELHMASASKGLMHPCWFCKLKLLGQHVIWTWFIFKMCSCSAFIALYLDQE